MSQPRPDFEPARIDKAVQNHLGKRLRALYRGVTEGPVPQDHINLLLALRRAERERRRGPDAQS